ncbi:MAG: endonuclease MutS2 [Eubacterium sp.]|nr:endonuclease MutS2 [Eubacterium sp.]
MDKRSLKVLEYDKIIAQLRGFCVCEGGKEMAEKLLPMDTEKAVRTALATTEETVEMMMRNGRPPMAEIRNAGDYVRRAAIGSMLTTRELLNIAALLRVVKDMENYYYNDTQMETLVYLKEDFRNLDPCEDFEREISKKILSEGEIADNASPELARIRREINFKNTRISDKLNGIISASHNDKYLQDKIITIRNNRYVVPVKQEYRSQIPGIVLDRSASGATLFIEPLSVVELNNDLKVLAAEEEKEITRILKDLSEKAAAYKEEIITNYDILVHLDFQFGKGKYGLSLGGVSVQVSEDGQIHLLKARHPLIDAKAAVASDIVMAEGIGTMIITGPNTGGKTVTLKTIGLLSLMAQSGLFIPVREGSSTRIFPDIYADIGDEQSIEQSLSTFSSHMKNIVDIMAKADGRSLVLFDELGAGTDPTEGAALAISVLDALHSRGVVSVSTTHYSELKEYALVTEGVVNASVEFDVETLRPTFRLLIGIPGKSNAFEIAKRLGLPSEIIDASKRIIDSEAIRFEETLTKIEEKRRQTEAEHDEIRRLRQEIAVLKEEAQKERERIHRESEAMLERAQEEASHIVSSTRKETEEIYKEIRYIQETTAKEVKDNKKLESLRRRIKDQEKSIFDIYKVARPEVEEELTVDELKPGMKVYIKSLRKEAEVLKVIPKDNQVQVQADIMKLKVGVEDLARSKAIAKPKAKQVTYKAVDRHVMDTKLDLRGKNGEESLYLVDKMISDAVLSGTHQLMIVHGKGTGKLRQVIHAYLKDNQLVTGFRLGAPNEGGSGVTVVEL